MAMTITTERLDALLAYVHDNEFVPFEIGLTVETLVREVRRLQEDNRKLTAPTIQELAEQIQITDTVVR